MKTALEDLLIKQNRSIRSLALTTAIEYKTLHNICKNKTTLISFDVLEKICIALDCTPNDILIIESDK